jgi:hypothetical protein
MKKLNEMQKDFIINSALNNGKTMEQAMTKVAEKEASMNAPKKKSSLSASRLNSFDCENENGFM